MVILVYLAPVIAVLRFPFMEARRTQDIGMLLLGGRLPRSAGLCSSL